MKKFVQLAAVASVFCSISQAQATPYYANYAPAPGTGEINASVGGLNARSLVAAGRMGLKFWNNTSSSELSLLGQCQSKTPAGTTWKESCNYGGLTGALNAITGVWIGGSYPDQTSGINAIISALSSCHSPAVVPLYGHATHWGTIYMIDSTGSTLNGLQWYDSGPSGSNDGEWTFYVDGVAGSDGVNFKNVFYKVLSSSYLSASDPYLNKFLTLWEPPFRVSESQAADMIKNMPPVVLNRSPGVILDDEVMSAKLAQDRVWDALYAAGVHESPHLWSGIEKGLADTALEVHGATPDGTPWDYYLVPIRDEFGGTLGLVQLSAEDGAYQQMWSGFQPIEFASVSAQEAVAIAERGLDEGDVLLGGDLTWSPSVENRVVPSPLFPYYEFYVFNKMGTFKERLLVTLQSGKSILPDSMPEKATAAER